MKAPCGHLLAKMGTKCPKCGEMWFEPASEPSPVLHRQIDDLTDYNESSLPSPELFSVGKESASQEKMAAMRLLAVGALCRKSFAAFAKEAWKHNPKLSATPLEWNWHHDVLCMHLQTIGEDWAKAVRDPERADAIQRIRNMAVSIAPGSTKTLLVMVFFPAWMWTRWPSWSVRTVSSNGKAVMDSSDETRQVVSSAWYQASFIPQTGEEPWAKANGLMPWQVRDDKDAKSDWGNTAGGSMRSSGLDANIIGEHTDAILVDDPHDSRKVHSAVIREENVSRFFDSIYNRVNDPRTSFRIVIMQRLHVEDLVGRILEKDSKKKEWCKMILASEFEPDHTYATPIWKDTRKPGELLWPKRYNRAKLDEALAGLMPRGYAAQHQQRPDAESSTNFKMSYWNWFVRQDHVVRTSWERPEACRPDAPFVLTANRDGSLDVDWVTITVDPTFGSTSEDASGVGLLITAGKKEKRFVLDDVSPGPRSFLEQVGDIKAAITTAVRLTGKRVIRVLVEKKASGGPGIETLEKEIKTGGDFTMVDGLPTVVHFEAYEIKSSAESKEQRGMAMEPDLARGDVYLPEGAPWLTAFFAEFRRFPAKPNDRVDALAQLIEKYRKKISWADAFKKVGR